MKTLKILMNALFQQSSHFHKRGLSSTKNKQNKPYICGLPLHFPISIPSFSRKTPMS